MRITLIRHTTLNVAPHICYGQSDVEVSSSFEAEAQALLQKLRGNEFDAVYASPLRRCHQLAQVLCAADGLQVVSEGIRLDERLKELHFGDWEMLPWDDIPREPFDRWANDYANLAPPNGETFTQLHARAKSFVEDVSSHFHDKNLLVVTHGGLIRALIAETLNLPLKRLFRIAVDHGSVTQLEFKGEVPRVLCINA
jgi:alpha-ribazole phosphatase